MLGLHQRSALSPYIFNVVIDIIIQDIRDKPLGVCNITNRAELETRKLEEVSGGERPKY